ncbi:hypothetical protein QLH51_19355 [Sphingomonas sp. 2R-10]|uniref:DUF6683 family protein n=1 Tax=Sphingomonas sp. 2R-10 TaxID=3045148 RepID=UPI000F776DD6|nr:DUF6683 family protein [Sphingomonas sp. 2R-10]MDJ0278948.1 hypothetical protein [Sphingomonas sp. 2R-10]
MASTPRNAAVGLLSGVLLCLCPVPVSAQDTGAAMDMTGMGIYAMEDAMMEAAGARVASAGPSLRRQFAAPPAARPAPVASLPYRVDPGVRQKVVRIFLDNGPKDPGYVAEVKQYVASGRVFREFAGIAPRFGFRTGDAVDAYAFYLMVQWGLANDYRPDPTRAQVAGVRAQAARALAPMAGSLGSSAARQEFADTLIAQGVLMAAAHGYAVKQGDTATLRKLASYARRGGAKVFDMDPTRLALVNTGFRPR